MLLFFSAPVYQRGTKQGDAVHVHPGRGAGAGEFFVEDGLFDDRGSAPAVFFGPPDADPTAFVEFLMPDFVSFPTLILG